MADVKQTKLLTFQSWVTHWDWYQYAVQHPVLVPHLLIDRSPCQDPFFDLQAARAEERRPLITGLCRKLRNFAVGDQFIYVTRVDPDVCNDLGIRFDESTIPYLGVAALVVKHVWPSHGASASSFKPRRYVACPEVTPYPPNLAHTDGPIAAAARESSIVHLNHKSFTPECSTADMWRRQYVEYYERQLGTPRDAGRVLRAAECRFETIDGNEAIQVSPLSAPVITVDDRSE